MVSLALSFAGSWEMVQGSCFGTIIGWFIAPSKARFRAVFGIPSSATVCDVVRDLCGLCGNLEEGHREASSVLFELFSSQKGCGTL